MSLQQFSKADWLNRMYRKSNSARTKMSAATSLRMFGFFCDSQHTTEQETISRYHRFVQAGDVRSVCLSFDKFIQFLGEDHPEFKTFKFADHNRHAFNFKKKSPKTVRTYFGFVKSYLRICHDVKISTDDIKDYVQFPKIRKEPRQAISLETLKLIIDKASSIRRALYLTQISSGIRLGEALALTKKNFHFDENPVRLTLDAEITKQKEGRDTYISSEAVDRVKMFIDGKKDNEKVFTEIGDLDRAVIEEEHYFGNLRARLGLLDRYPNSVRFLVNIHCFRAYFSTKASQKHGMEYAHALDGHSGYMKQYYRMTSEDRANKYKELEPDLLVLSVKLKTEKATDKIIENMQEQMKQLQHKIACLELLNKA